MIKNANELDLTYVATQRYKLFDEAWRNILPDNWLNKFSVESVKQNTIENLKNIHDYIVNNTGKVVRGNQSRKGNVTYQLTFVCHHQELLNCPSCGAPLNGDRVCKYCHTTIQGDGSSMKLAKKEIKYQR